MSFITGLKEQLSNYDTAKGWRRSRYGDHQAIQSVRFLLQSHSPCTTLSVLACFFPYLVNTTNAPLFFYHRLRSSQLTHRVYTYVQDAFQNEYEVTLSDAVLRLLVDMEANNLLERPVVQAVIFRGERENSDLVALYQQRWSNFKTLKTLENKERANTNILTDPHYCLTDLSPDHMVSALALLLQYDDFSISHLNVLVDGDCVEKHQGRCYWVERFDQSQCLTLEKFMTIQYVEQQVSNLNLSFSHDILDVFFDILKDLTVVEAAKVIEAIFEPISGSLSESDREAVYRRRCDNFWRLEKKDVFSSQKYIEKFSPLPVVDAVEIMTKYDYQEVFSGEHYSFLVDADEKTVRSRCEWVGLIQKFDVMTQNVFEMLTDFDDFVHDLVDLVKYISTEESAEDCGRFITALSCHQDRRLLFQAYRHLSDIEGTYSFEFLNMLAHCSEPKLMVDLLDRLPCEGDVRLKFCQFVAGGASERLTLLQYLAKYCVIDFICMAQMMEMSDRLIRSVVHLLESLPRNKSRYLNDATLRMLLTKRRSSLNQFKTFVRSVSTSGGFTPELWSWMLIHLDSGIYENIRMLGERNINLLHRDVIPLWTLMPKSIFNELCAALISIPSEMSLDRHVLRRLCEVTIRSKNPQFHMMKFLQDFYRSYDNTSLHNMNLKDKKQTVHINSIKMSAAKTFSRFYEYYQDTLIASGGVSAVLKKFRQAIIVRQKFYENKQQRVNRGKLALECFDYFTSGTFVFSDEITGHSMQLIFALAFLAIHDKARCKTIFVETLAYSEEALDYFIDGFYEIENGVLVGEESADDTRQQPGVKKRKCTRGVYHKLLEKLAGIHSGAEMEVLTPQTATWRLQSLVKHQVKHYLATLDDVSYERWSTQLREEAGIPAELWNQLSELVARTLYDEYQGLYNGPQSTDFLLMLDSGQYVDCRQLDFSRTPYDQRQSLSENDHGRFFSTQVSRVTREEGCLEKCSSLKT